MFAFRNIDADIEEGEYFSISDYFGGGELFWEWEIIYGGNGGFGGNIFYCDSQILVYTAVKRLLLLVD